jgi:hypothetical protein
MFRRHEALREQEQALATEESDEAFAGAGGFELTPGFFRLVPSAKV